MTSRSLHCRPVGRLCMRFFETRTATGRQPFPLLTCRHTMFSPLEMISIKIWETQLSWHAKCSLLVAAHVLKTRVLKLPIPPLPDVRLSQKEIDQMLDYALPHGAAVRQKANRQEIAMVQHGSLPELIYQRQLEKSADKVDILATGQSHPYGHQQIQKRLTMNLRKQLIVTLTRYARIYQSLIVALMKSNCGSRIRQGDKVELTVDSFRNMGCNSRNQIRWTGTLVSW